jgi:neurofibromin 1
LLSDLQEHRFIEDLIKNANTASKFSEVALVCALDMCRVAFHIRPEGEVPLRVIGSDIAHEIKVCVFSDSVPSPVVHASASQVALYKTHQGKPFWESSDEIDVGLYAEAIATVFRFLPEEEWTPMLVKCLEPERSEAVKIAVARAGLILAIEVRSHCLIS